MSYQKEIIKYLNELSYIKKGYIKVFQVAKDTDFSNYQCSATLEELVAENKIIRRYEVVDIDTALNYGTFKSQMDVPKEYTTDDGKKLEIGINGKIKVFYRFKNAHEFIK